jgi:hypothetical protein
MKEPLRHRDDHTTPGAEPVKLSPEYLAAVRRWENAPFNRDGEDKTWVHDAMLEAREHFAKAKRA